MKANSHGFTLIEILVVVAIFVALLAASILFVRPKSYATASDDANRRLGIAAMAQGLNDYHKKVGVWPADLPIAATPIANQSGSYDLCKYLVPTYLQDLAYDPQAGTVYTGEEDDLQPTADACNTKGVTYITSYTIQKNTDGSVTLSAPAARGGIVQVTIR